MKTDTREFALYADSYKKPSIHAEQWSSRNDGPDSQETDDQFIRPFYGFVVIQGVSTPMV